MQYTGIAAYPRRINEFHISFYELSKIECFAIKGLFIVFLNILILFEINGIKMTMNEKTINFICQRLLILGME